MKTELKKELKKIKSPKAEFIERMEELLLMNMLLPGERLPAERDLARQMGVSRPVIHEGLLELGSRGLISIRSRHGWIVNDFAKDGSLSLLNSLYRFSSSPMAAKIDSDLEEVRRIILTQSLKKYFEKCGKNKTDKKESGDLAGKLSALVGMPERESDKKNRMFDVQSITERDFLFYRCIIEAGGNMIFMLLFNSARELYHKKLESFFSFSRENRDRADNMKRDFIEALKSGRQKKALALIERMTSYDSYEADMKSVRRNAAKMPKKA